MSERTVYVEEPVRPLSSHLFRVQRAWAVWMHHLWSWWAFPTCSLSIAYSRYKMADIYKEKTCIFCNCEFLPVNNVYMDYELCEKKKYVALSKETHAIIILIMKESNFLLKAPPWIGYQSKRCKGEPFSSGLVLLNSFTIDNVDFSVKRAPLQWIREECVIILQFSWRNLITPEWVLCWWEWIEKKHPFGLGVLLLHFPGLNVRVPFPWRHAHPFFLWKCALTVLWISPYVSFVNCLKLTRRVRGSLSFLSHTSSAQCWADDDPQMPQVPRGGQQVVER